ncbi:hypothetical protein LG200_01235 [Methylobacillus caricis]|uniref:hypothetical protein n=1 Tax=Methylobacillus caricis TaxID=1971611 RepID=UPI001CFFB36B|nr:hypothetical protein [Methylobacillus caricis]MCB5186624.1 hypothetical protein [Methylobacillus caricis]
MTNILLITFLSAIAGAAGAGELCYSELKHAFPVHGDTKGLLSIGVYQAPVKNGIQQSQPTQFKRYQKPVLSEKGTCLYKPSGFKSSSIKM